MHSITLTIMLFFILIPSIYGMGGKENSTPLEFEVIEESEQGGTSEELFLTAHTEDEFKYIWDLTHQHIEPKPEMPEVNFDEYTVVCIMMGERPSNDYSVDVSEVVAYEDSVIVGYSYDEIGGMLTIMAYPYEIVKFPKTTKRIVFKYRSEL